MQSYQHGAVDNGQQAVLVGMESDVEDWFAQLPFVHGDLPLPIVGQIKPHDGLLLISEDEQHKTIINHIYQHVWMETTLFMVVLLHILDSDSGVK